MIRIEILHDRAAMLAASRTFFAERNVVEVDTPILCRTGVIDTHIDLIPATYDGAHRRYLHSSPEFGMKQLLAAGSGDIYQLSHVFRDGEQGDRHSPEFMMAEWYRINMPFEELITETCSYCRLFVGEIPSETVTYRDAFITHAKVDPFTASVEDLRASLTSHGIDLINSDCDSSDELLNILLGAVVEPQLGKSGLTAIIDYPSSQAALAKTRHVDGFAVAERFELYYKGVELANGYHELTDAREQRKRFEEANEERVTFGKAPLPLDEAFIDAIGRCPDSCGVAVGFDRLMMLRHDAQRLAEVTCSL